MQFLADENFPFESISLSITPGFKVRNVTRVYKSKPDIFLFHEAILNKEILSFNKDFLSLVGIPTDYTINKSSTIWNAPNPTVIDEHKIRQRPIFKLCHSEK